MFATILKQTIRKILKNRTFSVINVLGLSIGLTCCILAFLYIQDELKYDKHFKDSENIYRMLGNNFFDARPPDIFQPSRFMDEILLSIPEIESGVRISRQDVYIGYKTDYQIEKNIFYADSNFFSFFSWPLVQGDTKTALTKAFAVVLSQKKAKEYFGDANPMGKTLRLDNSYDMIVTGVFKDFPEQSHIKPEMVISFLSLEKENPGCFNSWGCFNCRYYLKSIPNTSKEILDRKLTNLWNSFEDKAGGSTGDHVYLIVQPFRDIYLKSGYLTERSRFGSIYNVMAIAIITLFILIIVCFNFVNLTAALLGKYRNETGINKVLGAGRKTFATKVITEVLIYISCSILFSFLAVSLILPYVNSLVDKNLSIGIYNLIPLLLFILGLSIVILLATSIYPVIVMQKTDISGVLQGVFNISLKTVKSNITLKGNFRNSLVVVQFTCGIILILSAVIVNKQMQFIRHKDQGFDKEQLVVIQNPYQYPMVERYLKFKQNIEQYPQIKMISAGRDVPGKGINNWTGGIGVVTVDYDYFATLGTKFIAGRTFDHTRADMGSAIINEKLLKYIRQEEPELEVQGIPLDGRVYKIIGVVKNMEFTTVHYEDKFALFRLQDSYSYSRNIIIRLSGGNISDGMGIIQKEWKRAAPNWPLNYYFMDEQFEDNYHKETRTSKVVNALTVVALFLCCLGLYGLALFSITGRIKEIGIRKVNGAKARELLSMLNKEFIMWVILAFAIASPIAWIIMQRWLENFIYKTNIQWWDFALTGIAALAIAIYTVSWQSWRAAMRNPVEALRYE